MRRYIRNPHFKVGLYGAERSKVSFIIVVFSLCYDVRAYVWINISLVAWTAKPVIEVDKGSLPDRFFRVGLYVSVEPIRHTNAFPTTKRA